MLLLFLVNLFLYITNVLLLVYLVLYITTNNRLPGIFILPMLVQNTALLVVALLLQEKYGLHIILSESRTMNYKC